MTSRGPGRASRTLEMEEKEQLRRQIRLLQGLIDDYKNLHGNASAPGTSAASQWQPPAYSSGRAFSARCPRLSRRGFSPNHGPVWRKKYSLVNRPLGSSDPPGDCAAQPPLGAGGSQGPEPQQYILERQVQLSPDQNMVIDVKPPSKPGSAGTAGVLRGSLEEYGDAPWSNHRPQEGEGELPGGQQQPSRPGRAKGSCSEEDPLLVCQKEPGKPRVVKSMSTVSSSPSEPRRMVGESAVAARARFPPSSPPQRGGTALGRKVGSQPAANCGTQLLGDGRANAGHADQSAASGLVAGPARPAAGPRQTREPLLLVSCRSNKFRQNNYKWVAASAKSPRAPRRALSPRAVAENVCKAPFSAAERTEKPQLRGDLDAKPRRSAAASVPGASPSKYKWKASSPLASSASSFRWQSEAGSKDHASQLSPVPSRFPPGDRPAVGPSSLKPLFSETPLSAYKVKSRTKIIRRRGSASLPGDKKSSPPPATTARSQFSLRRRQALRGKSSPVLKKTPNKGLMQVSRHRLCCLPPGRAHLPTKEASSLHGQRTPPTSKVIKTRYRIVKKTQASPLSPAPGPLAPPSWRALRLSLSRPLGPCQQLQPLPGQPGRAAQPGHRAAGAAEAAAEEGGVLHVLQPLRQVQPRRALPLHPRPREGGRVHQVRPLGPPCGWGGGFPGLLAPQTLPVCLGLFGARARRRTGPAPSPTTSPRRSARRSTRCCVPTSPAGASAPGAPSAGCSTATRGTSAGGQPQPRPRSPTSRPPGAGLPPATGPGSPWPPIAPPGRCPAAPPPRQPARPPPRLPHGS
ncbi:zinc finger CCCH domain-containing protein 3 isoform X3 [Lagenorhynchus albirostris]|uniref:zinc finger CCCH domain-containing protein 3 isoform X3 n=1 Tax=Lagenorhynchus albirostris TaxID=27610 RepID=UPI0028E7E6B0|nr:zinc finger CCCH domain-containing protein 3 isoform X3 [Lagenorhynchus albirostris]